VEGVDVDSDAQMDEEAAVMLHGCLTLWLNVVQAVGLLEKLVKYAGGDKNRHVMILKE
jgi:hypothetical protein